MKTFQVPILKNDEIPYHLLSLINNKQGCQMTWMKMKDSWIFFLPTTPSPSPHQKKSVQIEIRRPYHTIQITKDLLKNKKFRTCLTKSLENSHVLCLDMVWTKNFQFCPLFFLTGGCQIFTYEISSCSNSTSKFK